MYQAEELQGVAENPFGLENISSGAVAVAALLAPLTSSTAIT